GRHTPPRTSPLFPYTTLFRSCARRDGPPSSPSADRPTVTPSGDRPRSLLQSARFPLGDRLAVRLRTLTPSTQVRILVPQPTKKAVPRDGLFLCVPFPAATAASSSPRRPPRRGARPRAGGRRCRW